MAALASIPKSQGWAITYPKSKTEEGASFDYGNFLLQEEIAESKGKAKLIVDVFRKNMDQSALDTFRIISFLDTKKIGHKSAFLKVNDISNFSVIVVVSREDFFRAEFLESYSIVNSIRKETETNSYHIDFSFMPVSNTEEVNKELLGSDGFDFQLNVEDELNQRKA